MSSVPSNPPDISSAANNMDLRHMTSTGALHANNASTRRVSQRIGSRSPASIPSSPTSVHSSSSAIFERDIEPIVSPSPPHSHDPHRIPRAKATEALEQSVPSVLDSAASILAGLQDAQTDQVAVETPALLDCVGGGRRSGVASPIGSFRSRSPSPGASGFGPSGGKGGLLLSIPHPHSQSPPRPQPTISTNISPTSQQFHAPAPAPPPQPTETPSIVTPTSAYFSTTSSVASEAESSPTTTTREKAPDFPDDVDVRSPMVPSPPPPSAVEPSSFSAYNPNTTASSTSPHQSSLFSSSTPPYSQSHTSPSLSPHASSPASSPRQPAQSLSGTSSPSSAKVATKRLSFMSYADLLTSTPASTLPLSSLTSTSMEPPHIPSVAGYGHDVSSVNGNLSAAGSLKGFPLTNVKEPAFHNHHFKERDSMLDDLVGGEWEREGLGRGLEERLEAVVGSTSAPSSVVGKA
ncbi:hypothetical protein Moror_1770 [Moniliophthora roreri MCA 2997]|uniref:Uncharacterized protein n=1 Tax=Moniliophthora roreri (strain MCA 2997) TaxID=1381753 RepID=V2YNV2_MONRO|nr:hypothetical protein Moror_1770 [Moniliophthora roreri MCA 2997]